MLSDDDDVIDSDERAPDIKLPGVRKGRYNQLVNIEILSTVIQFHSRRF